MVWRRRRKKYSDNIEYECKSNSTAIHESDASKDRAKIKYFICMHVFVFVYVFVDVIKRQKGYTQLFLFSILRKKKSSKY